MDTTIKVRAKLIELWNRLISYDKNSKVYTNGHDNLYPNEMERAVGNSPTASRSASMMAKYIAGAGIKQEDIIVNVKKNKSLTDTIKDMAHSIAVQNGIYIHVGYRFIDGKWTQSKLTVFDYVQCRIGKEDDNDNPNKIWVGNWETVERTKIFTNRTSKTRANLEEKKFYYPYNPDPEIIASQVEADSPGPGFTLEEKIQNYRGQVLYVNLTPNHKYALSKFDGVYNDCDTEYRMSLYSNTMFRGGLLGKTAVLTQGLEEDQAKQVVDDIQKWLGAENSSSIYHLDVVRTDDLENVLKIIQVPSQYDDDMAVNTDKRIRRNITGAANNIPEALIYSGDNALFGTSGDTYREMKEFYTEQTQEEREIIEKTLRLLGFEVEIIPLGAEDPAPAPEPERQPERQPEFSTQEL